MKPGSWLFLIVALAGGGFLLWRALESGNPLYYFLSAVGFGMAIAVLQPLFGKGRGRD